MAHDHRMNPVGEPHLNKKAKVGGKFPESAEAIEAYDNAHRCSSCGVTGGGVEDTNGTKLCQDCAK